MTPERQIEGFALKRVAPAKINLALHVVGQRDDGYHLLESLVTFADAGDRIGFSLSEQDRFTVSGPFAAQLDTPDTQAPDNLVVRARDLLRACLETKGLSAPPVHLHLEKNLPIASGIGGGSADAAATLLGLIDLWDCTIDTASLGEIALRLGADVPMCLSGQPLAVRGIGEHIDPLAAFPSFPMLIVNPLKPVSTPRIFSLLNSKHNPSIELANEPRTLAEWIGALAGLRNDLEPPARLIEPDIDAVSNALARSPALFSRMSGSGASCFAIYGSIAERDAAATDLLRLYPGWYVLACESVGTA